MSYADLKREHLRLAMLRLLAEMPDYTLNASMLQDATAHVGVPASRVEVEAEIGWLRDAGLVTTKVVGDNKLLVATITDRGAEVAAGRTTAPGVKKPSPSGR